MRALIISKQHTSQTTTNPPVGNGEHLSFLIASIFSLWNHNYLPIHDQEEQEQSNVEELQDKEEDKIDDKVEEKLEEKLQEEEIPMGAEYDEIIDQSSEKNTTHGEKMIPIPTPRVNTIRLITRRSSPCPWCRGARCVKWGTILLPIAWACTYYAYLKVPALKQQMREEIRKDYKDEDCHRAHNLTMRWQYLYYRLMREETPWKFEQEVEMRPEIIAIMAEGDAT